MLLFMLFFSILEIVASIYLIRWHRYLDDLLDIYASVDFTDFVLSGVFGYLGLSVGIGCLIVDVVLLILKT